MRIHGFQIPVEKRVDIALSYLYGVGRSNVRGILKKAQIDGSVRVKNLTEEEQKRIQRVLDEYRIEGDLRAQVLGDIRRLKEVGSYRGHRHARNLPVRGQRTRSNARTKRGKRVTIGAIKKELAAKIEGAGATKARTSAPEKK